MTYEEYILSKVITTKVNNYELLLESVVQTEVSPSTYLKGRLDKRIISVGLRSIFGYVEGKSNKPYNTYFYLKYRKEILNEDVELLKKCVACNTEHSLTNFYSNGYYKGKKKYKSKCKKCHDNEIKYNKENLILSVFKSYSCCLCGYNKCKKALEFHHLDPSKKEYKISDLKTHSKDKILLELSKCVLVCANCHREIHEGMHPEYLLSAE